MKKMITTVCILTLGYAFHVQAVSTNANQGNGDVVQTAPPSSGSQGVGNTVSTQEKNQVKNQGEDAQIQTQEQNAVQMEDSTQNKSNNGKANSTSNPSVQKRSQVADAVQAMLQIADRNGGIGQQVRVIAQSQNQNQVKLEQNIEKIQKRGGFVKFLMGPNYGEIKSAEATLAQNKLQIRQLNEIRMQISNAGDQQLLDQQIKVLEQANTDAMTLLSNAQSSFSLFGWLTKMLS